MHWEIITKGPPIGAGATPLLFVHGAWHGAWAWDVHFLDYFAAYGHPVTALSLRGHGQSGGHARLRWLRIADHVADLKAFVDQRTAPPLLIGHSLGGLVVQKYLERYAAPGAVLLAPVPTVGALGATLRYAQRHPREFLRGNATLSLYPFIGTPELTREAFFSATMPAVQVQAYFAQMQDESYRSFLDMVAFALPRPARVRVPLLVLGAANDSLFLRGEIEATARAYGTEAVIFPDMAHDMMLEADWQAVAAVILAWLRQQAH